MYPSARWMSPAARRQIGDQAGGEAQAREVGDDVDVGPRRAWARRVVQAHKPCRVSTCLDDTPRGMRPLSRSRAQWVIKKVGKLDRRWCPRAPPSLKPGSARDE